MSSGSHAIETTYERTPGPEWRSFGGWAGVLFVVTFLVAAAFALAPAPAGVIEAAEIRRWAIDEGTVYMTAMWVAMAMHLVFFLPFSVALVIVIDRTDRFLAGLVLVAAVGAAVTATLGTAFSASLALGSAVDLPDASIVAFWRADNFIFLVVLSGFQALFVGAAGLALYRRPVRARLLGSIGLVAAVVLLADGLWVVGGSFTDVFGATWLIGLGGFALWIIGAAVGMIRGGRGSWAGIEGGGR